MEVTVVERRKQIEVEAAEVELVAKELQATVRLPAAADAFVTQTLAEGRRTRTLTIAQAEAERTKLLGAADARAQGAIGRAEAQGMKVKAEAYKQYGDAAPVSMVLEVLPHLAGEVAAPLERTNEIVIVGGSNPVNKQITSLVSSLPPSVQALTGVDITGILAALPGAARG